MKTRVRLPPATFHLTADGGAEDVLVYLLPTANDLRLFTGSAEPHLMAACDGVADDPYVVAIVYLPLDTMGVGLVTHELTHATFRILQRRGCPVAANEELFCTVLGELVRAFYVRYYELEDQWKTTAE